MLKILLLKYRVQVYTVLYIVLCTLILMILFKGAGLPLLISGAASLGGAAIIFAFQREKKSGDEKLSTHSSADQSAPFNAIKSHNPQELAAIIKNITGATAVAIIADESILAFAGEDCTVEQVGKSLSMEAVKTAVSAGKTQIIKNIPSANGPGKDSEYSFERALIVPIYYRDRASGTIAFFHSDKAGISQHFIRVCIEISKLVSMQIELSQLDRQMQLATEARLDALQAQVNPHFLFNSLNAINMYVNKDPDFTRELIRRLSAFLRYTLGNNDRFTTIGDELKIIQDYIVIEKARFGDRLAVVIDVEEKLKKYKIPVMSVQPLVNNAIIHGILPKDGTGIIRITVRQIFDEIIVSVIDNGVGIDGENIDKIFVKSLGAGLGVGIPNVHERLKLLYGDDFGLSISSTPGKGTKASFRIPLNLDEGVIADADEGFDSR